MEAMEEQTAGRQNVGGDGKTPSKTAPLKIESLEPDSPRSKIAPVIYAYEDTHKEAKGLLKVGYTAKDVEKRIAAQYNIKKSFTPWRIVLIEPAVRQDGTTFIDHDVHRVLKNMPGVVYDTGEWFRCTVDDVRAAVVAVRNRTGVSTGRTADFRMRPEQERAVEAAAAYFQSAATDAAASGRVPAFLWNCKMRFGKTFAAYQLAKRLGLKRILILTFKPAVMSAWKEDLESHVDFEGWQFISRGTDLDYSMVDMTRPIVCFGSFQDYLGVNELGGIKAKNVWVHKVRWDLVILDEYHFGCWTDTAKGLFEQPDEEAEATVKDNGGTALSEQDLPIATDRYLYLSGTPFRSLNSGEFIEEQIYTWSYSDEQRAKAAWKGQNNPYEALPQLVMMTYRLPPVIADAVASGDKAGEGEFDLNELFRAETQKDGSCTFVHAEAVQKWLDAIRGAGNMLLEGRPALPYSDVSLLEASAHSLWFLPDVAACRAMGALLKARQNVFFHDYGVVVCAGPQAGIGAQALPPVQRAMKNPLKTKTITLTCGKLTTGVTVKPWTAIFMLRNLSSPETYFQAAFRVQSPWTSMDDDGHTIILKDKAYVFDFAPDRALRQLSDYACRIEPDGDPVKKVEAFTEFLPVFAYDGASMKAVSAEEILDIAMSGTSAVLLARRWQSAMLVNVDNATLKRVLDSPEALATLDNIEGFRNLNKDMEIVINKSEAVKKARKQGDSSGKSAKALNDKEKEAQNLRKKIQEKLVKFVTRIPIFMYLSDYRELYLKDVIQKIETELFRKATGLTQNDFSLLLSLGLFNSAVMDEAVYLFKRYEDKSLSYAGINRHAGHAVGGWSTVKPATQDDDDVPEAPEAPEAPGWDAEAGCWLPGYGFISIRSS